MVRLVKQVVLVAISFAAIVMALAGMLDVLLSVEMINTKDLEFRATEMMDTIIVARMVQCVWLLVVRPKKDSVAAEVLFKELLQYKMSYLIRLMLKLTQIPEVPQFLIHSTPQTTVINP